MLLKTGAVVEEGAVQWVIFGLIIHALCDISDAWGHVGSGPNVPGRVYRDTRPRFLWLGAIRGRSHKTSRSVCAFALID